MAGTVVLTVFESSSTPFGSRATRSGVNRPATTEYPERYSRHTAIRLVPSHASAGVVTALPMSEVECARYLAVVSLTTPAGDTRAPSTQ